MTPGMSVPRCALFTLHQPARAHESQALAGVTAEWPDPACALRHLGLGRDPSHLSGLSVPCPLPSPQSGTLTCELKDCPYCAGALGDPEWEFSDSESAGSEGNAVYEFTQDLRHGDRRDPMRPTPAADTPAQGGVRRPAQPQAASAQRGGLVRGWAAVSGKLRRIVDSKYFNRGIMAAILTNTLSMGIEYHEQVGGRLCELGPPGDLGEHIPCVSQGVSLLGTRGWGCGGWASPMGDPWETLEPDDFYQLLSKCSSFLLGRGLY